MGVYFNEFEAFPVQWLTNLFPGQKIDGRSIVDVRPGDLMGYGRCHFFAGIGGWEYALQLAGWSDDRPVWTGSCPCQPFSTAGKQKGPADERHLWPEFLRLIAECRPPTVFGEQVASKLGREWLAGVRADLEALGYAVGAADLCAAGVGAPHIRQRLYWVAYAQDGDWWCGERGAQEGIGAHGERGRRFAGGGFDGGLGHADDAGLSQRGSDGRLQRETVGSSTREAVIGAGAWANAAASRLADAERHAREPGRLAVGPGEGAAAPGAGPHAESGRRRDIGGLAHGEQPRLEGHAGDGDDGHQPGWVNADAIGSVAEGGNARGVRHPAFDGRGQECAFPGGSIAGIGAQGGGERPWDHSVAIRCLDGKYRRVPANAQGEPEPALFPLAHGVSNRRGRLSAYGNAIVPQVAAAFVKSFLEATDAG